MSEQFAHEGAPNGESTGTDVVDPTVESDELSASDVAPGAEDAEATDETDETDDEITDEAGASTDEADEDAEADEAGEAGEAGDDAPAATGSGDPVADFKADLRSRFGDWFVIHSYAGYENRVKANLETRIQTLNMEDFIFEIEVPMEEVTEIK
ncbi:MAG: transcription termination/antitermination NusG family protein, partial [Terrabacter sp.]